LPRYIDPTTDFGFKKIFGEEAQMETLLMLLSEKLGPVPADIDNAIRALKGEGQLDALLKRIAGITDWEMLRALLQ
jgi:hypothetical protein